MLGSTASAGFLAALAVAQEQGCQGKLDYQLDEVDITTDSDACLIDFEGITWVRCSIPAWVRNILRTGATQLQ